MNMAVSVFISRQNTITHEVLKDNQYNKKMCQPHMSLERNIDLRMCLTVLTP